MAVPLIKAMVIKTRKEIFVYQLENGKWGDCYDANTEYKESELRFL